MCFRWKAGEKKILWSERKNLAGSVWFSDENRFSLLYCSRFYFVMQIFGDLFVFFLFSAGKEQCNTPDSPEGARVIAPRSPMSPHIHPVNSIIPATNNRSSSVNRHNSSSPNVNGTPPPITTPSSAAALIASSSSAHDNQRLLKIRRFLGALVQFGQDTNADVGDRLRSLVLSLAVSNLI